MVFLPCTLGPLSVCKITFKQKKSFHCWRYPDFIIYKSRVEWHRLSKALLKSISTIAAICFLSMALKM